MLIRTFYICKKIIFNLSIAIYLFNALGASFTASSAEANATDEMVDQFATYPALVGLVGTIIFLGIVIGVLVASFMPSTRA
jgi:hypothetical protein